jgi:type III secretory pathway component EscU
MKRDVTVTISAVILIALLVTNGGDISNETFENLSGVKFHLLLWPFLFALLRSAILWFQTLLAAARPTDQKEAKVGWIIAHVLFGPFASYLFYYLSGKQSLRMSEEDLKRRANEGKL